MKSENICPKSVSLEATPELENQNHAILNLHVKQLLPDGAKDQIRRRYRNPASKQTGRTKHPLYGRWRSMIGRCKYKSHTSYKWYGARGIKVVARWLDFESFITDMGEPPFPRASIERLNNNDAYSPENCCWASSKQQQRNRRNNIYLMMNGVMCSATEWAERIGVSPELLHCRKERGWSDIRTLTEPINANTIKVTWHNITLTLKQWAKLLNIQYGSLWYRYKKNWPIERMLGESIQISKSRIKRNNYDPTK